MGKFNVKSEYDPLWCLDCNRRWYPGFGTPHLKYTRGCPQCRSTNIQDARTGKAVEIDQKWLDLRAKEQAMESMIKVLAASILALFLFGLVLVSIFWF